MAITNRKLVAPHAFFTQIERICQRQPRALVLREKDLTLEEYVELAKVTAGICETYQVPFVVHSFYQILDCPAFADGEIPSNLHMPLAKVKELSVKERKRWGKIGTSVHSLQELEEAQQLGVSYVFAGHVFPTDCKKGVPARGLDFLKEICAHSKVPVYAIGGVDKSNQQMCFEQGAAGICIMSGAMQI